MKTAWIAVFALLFVSAAGFAETPAPRVSLAQALGQSACPAPEGAVFLAGKPAKPARPDNLEKALCTATAQCASGTVYCESNTSATSCASYDRNCSAGEQGRVVCNGVTTWCPTACPTTQTCTTGTLRQRACCRCAETDNCWDCDFCANGYHTVDACP